MNLHILSAPANVGQLRAKNIKAGAKFIRENILSVAPHATWGDVLSVMSPPRKMGRSFWDKVGSVAESVGGVAASVVRTGASLIGAAAGDPSLGSEVAQDITDGENVGDTVAVALRSNSPAMNTLDVIGSYVNGTRDTSGPDNSSLLPASSGGSSVMEWISCHKKGILITVAVLAVVYLAAKKRR